MRFLEWLNRCLGKTPPASNLEFHSLRADRQAGLELVRLEERIVLNVDAGVTGVASDILQISLDAANDEATVSVVDGGATIQVDDGQALPGSIMQFDASQLNSILVTGTDTSQTINFLGQNNLNVPDSLDLTGFTGDVNIGIQIQVGTASDPDFSSTSTVTYLGQYDRVGDHLNVVLQNQVGADDAYAVQIDGTDLQIVDQNHSNALLYSTSLAGLNSIQIQGADGETDLLSLDYSDAQLTQLSISFEGGLGGNDTLEFYGGTFDTITHHLTGAGTGSVDFSGNAITEINYSGLEPVYGGDNTADNVVIELPAATTDAVLENSPLTGETQIRSLSSSFELTTFASPADSLKITTAGSNSLVTLNSYDTSFAPTDLILAGQAGDAFQLGGSDLLNDSVSLTLAGGATLDLDTFNETVDQFTLEDGTVIATGGILTAQSNLDLQSGSVKAQLNGNDLVKNGSGTVILDALNGYSGTTTINDGTLKLAQSYAIPNSSSVDLTSVTSVLDLDGNSLSLTSLTGTGSVLLGSPAGSLTLNQAVSTSATFDGEISGDGSLTISGAGEVVLTGDSTISGATQVQDGLLTVDGSLGTSEVIVATGATLGGSGSINAPVTVNANAALAPGSSPGLISTGDLTLDADANLNLDIEGTAAGSEYDQIQVTGEVVLSGASLNISSSFTATAGDQFMLINNTGLNSVTGEFVNRAEGTLFNFNGNQVYITYHGGDGNDVVLVVNTPPTAGNQSFSIDENTANTTSVGTIVAADPDVPPGSLTFSLTGGSGQTAFAVSNDGEITVADVNQLDYESTTSFDLEILVTDDAGATDTATITVNLNPVNDNAPVVLNQTRDIDENSVNGTSVGAVIAASDDDLPNDTLTFTEVGGSGTAAFDISTSGQITVADQSLLDYENTTSFTLDVMVSDGVNATDTATITINLNPVNDNPPVVNNQVLSVDENTANGTSVGAVIPASDPDLPNDSLTFSKTGGSGAAAFDISSSGQITVADQSLLDYENTTSFDLQILVTDAAGATDTATITINLNPVNDNAPVVLNQTRDIDENSVNGTSVGAVIAASDDDLPNDTLTFTEVGGSGAAAFDISSSGQITVADQGLLDYENTTSFTLDIMVSDGVNATDTATITINLNPLNDNIPAISNQTRYVDENAANGTLVGAVISASDADQPGDNLTFSEAGGTGAAAFNITAAGQIVVADQSLLNFETNPSYTLDVIVDDNAGSTSTATITINLNDLVENMVVAAGDWSSNDITIIRDGSQLRILETGTSNEIVPAHEFDKISSIIITGNGSDNTVRLDMSVDTILPTGGISFDGAGGSNTLVGADQTTDWLIDGANTGSLLSGAVSFSNVANLTGNGGADSFVFQDGGQLTGTLSGGNGSDSIDFSAVTSAVTVDLQNSSATGLNQYAGIEQVTGDGTLDTISGLSAGTTYLIEGVNQGSVAGIDFDGFSQLAGSGGVDTFQFSGNGQITGSIDGLSGNDILDFTASNFSLDLSLTSTGAIDGFAGTDAGALAAFDNINSIQGSSNSDTLTGMNATAIWTLNGAQQYDSTNSLSFSGFENLTGGTDVDTFNITGTQVLNLAGNSGNDVFAFADAATLDGTLDGQAGADQLDYSALTTSIDVVLSTNGTFDGFQGTESTISGGFDNINSIVAGAGTADKLTGQNAAATWSIQPASIYASGTSLAFSSFETLQGGSDVDQFNINGSHTLDLQGGLGDDVFRFSNNGSTLTGTIDGQAGSDHLDLVNYTADLNVTLSGLGSSDGFDGTESAKSVSFANINQLTGGSGTNALAGIDATAIWTLNGTNQYTSTNALSFSGFTNLSGGTDVDTFNITGSQSLNLAGNSGSDIFAFADGAALDGTLDGQAGADELDFSALTSSIDVILTANGSFDGFQGTEATISGGFDNINNIVAGAGTADKLTGQNAAATWSIQPASTYGSGTSLAFSSFETLQGGSDVDQFNINGAHTLDLEGGLGDDVFRFSNNGSTLTGTIDGQAGSDHLDLVNYTADLNVTLSGLGSSDGFDGTESAKSVSFANIDQLTGGSGTNTLNGIDNAATWTLDGTNTYTSTNTLTFSSFLNLTGGSDTDIFNVTPDTEAFQIVGGNPTTNTPGDQLNVDTSAVGTAVVSNNDDGSGSVTGTFPTITYSEIESFTITGTADASLAGSDNADEMEILVNGTDIEYYSGGVLIGTSSLADTTTITIKGGDGDDSLTVDAALAAAGITIDYDGQGQDSTSPGDVLNLLGTTTSVEYYFTDSSSGSVRVDGSATDFITYSGLEPITSTINAANVTLNYSSAAEIFTISDAGGGQTTITSTAGEMLTFTNPTGLVTLNTGDGADQIELNSLASDFTASLTINGEGDADTLNLNGSLTLASGKDLELNVETINIVNDLTLTASSITFGGTVDGASSLEVNTAVTTIFNEAVGSSVALTSLTTNANGTTQINGGSIETTGVQIYNNDVELGADTTLSSTDTGAITFDQNLNGAQTLQVNTAGTTTFNGLVGNISALTSLTTDSVGDTQINGGAVTTTGAQVYHDNVELGADTSLTSTGTDAITFDLGLDGAHTLEVNTSGITTFGGAVGNTTALTSLTTDAGGTTQINGGSVKTTGDQIFADAVLLGDNTVLTSSLSGTIQFKSTLNGAHTLAINTGGTTIFDGLVGNNTALTSLTTDAAGSTEINGTAITTTGSQFFYDNATLGNNTTLNSTDTGAITFDQSLDGAQTLNMNTDGITTFNGAVGDGVALVSLTTNAGGTTQINGGSIKTTGDQIFHDAMELGDNTILTSTGNGALTFNGTLNGAYTLDLNTTGATTFNSTVGNSAELASLTTDANGTTNVNGGTIATTNGQLFNDAVVLGANTVLSSSDSGSIQFKSTLNGGYTLNVNTEGTTIFADQVGNSAALVSLTTDAGGTTQINGMSIDTSGDQIFHDAVELGADTFLTSTGSGAITFNGTLNGAYALEVDTSGDTTFNDSVGDTDELASLSTDANGTTYINGGSVATSGGQVFNDAVELGDDTIISSSSSGVIQFVSTLNGAHTLEVNTADSTSFDGLVGNSAALTSLTTDAAGSTLINAGTIKTVGAQFYYDDVELISDTTLTSTDSGTITFDQRLNGTHTLQVNTGGSTVFNDTVGDTDELASLTTDQDGSTSINGTAINTTGAQVYHDNVELGADTSLASNGTDAITFDLGLDGAHTLEVNTSGITTFGGAVGNTTALTSLTTDAGGTTQINGGSVKTTGDQIFTDAVLLGDNTVLTSSLSGTIQFKSTLNGAHTLAINTGGTTIFDGLVGNSAALTSLTTDAAGSTEINGTAITTTGSQFFYDDTTLGDNTTLNSTDTGAITFDQNLNGAQTLQVNTAGTTTFNGLVGNSSALTSLTTDSAGDTQINGGAITTTGSQIYHDTVLLGANTTLTSTGTDAITFDLSLNGAYTLDVNTSGVTTFSGAVGNGTALASLTTDVGGTTRINGGSINTVNGQIFYDDVELGAGTTLTSTDSGTITFDQKLDGGQTLNVNTAGITLFNGAVGSGVALVSLTTDAAGTTQINGTSIDTSGAQIFHDAVELGADTFLTSTGSGAITFNGTLNGSHALEVDTDGDTTFNDTVGDTDELASLSTDANGTTYINGGSIATSGGQVFNDAVELGADTVVSSSSSGVIQFASTLNGAQTLDINTAGTTVLGGLVGNSTALTSLATDAAGDTQINGSAITTTGSQIYYDTVDLGANTILTSTDTGAITFDLSLDGAFTLNVNTDGITTFNGALGSNSALTSLTTDANGTTRINGGSIQTTGDQIFHDAVELGDNTTLTSTGSGALTFNETLNGAFTLNLNTGGSTTFNNTVGNSDALASLTTDASGTTEINGGSIETTGNQEFQDAVELGANTILTSSSSGDLLFDQSLNGGFTLNLNTDGNNRFSSTVGDTDELVSLTTNAGGNTYIVGGSIATSGGQFFNDAVILEANTVLSSSADGTIQFISTLNGTFNLNVNTDGTTIFDDLVGNTDALLSLTTDANGTTQINGTSIDTSGDQIFHDAVDLGDNTTLTSSGSGALTFDETVNGAFTLNLNTDGSTTFNNTVGNSTALVSLTTNTGGTTRINGTSIDTSGAQIFHDAVELGADTFLTSTGSGAITFDGTLNGAYALEVDTSGDTNFNNTVGDTNELDSVSTDANGTTYINGGSIATSGGQVFNDAVMLGADTVVSSSSSGVIQFAATLNGAHTLNVNTAGDTVFGDQVGNSASLTSLTTNAGGTTQINGGSIETTGDQIFNDDVALGANTTLTSSGSGAITFNQRLNGAYTLNLNTNGDTTFNGTVGDTDELASLTTDANGTTNINGGSIATTDGQLFNDAVLLGANTVLSSSDSGSIQFKSTLDGGYDLEVNTGGDTIFDDQVGNSTALANLTTDAGGTTQINGTSIDTSGAQIFHDAVELGADTFLTSTGSGAITFDGTLNGAYALEVDTDGDTTFNDTVGDTNELASLSTDVSGTTYINGGSIATSGGQVFNDAVMIGANTVVSSSANGVIQFASTLNGAHTLNINTAGTTVLGGLVGNSAALTSLTTDAAGDTQIDGTAVTTTGSQIYYDTVDLGANTILTSTGTGAITFDLSLDGAFTLNVNTDGITTFNGALGSNSALTSLTTDANGTTRINGGSIQTTGDQIFNDDVALGANTTLTSSGSGAITFNQRLNGAYTLNLNTNGDTTFNGTVGDADELVSLTTDANGTTNVNGGSIATTDGQLFNDAVLLGANTVLSSSGSGSIQFKSTLDGGYNLEINTGGDTIFDDQVGNSTALASLTTDVNGTTEVNGGTLTTTGSQTFHDVVTLGASAVFTSTTSDDITFDQTLTGGSGISLEISSAENVIFKDAVSTDGAVTITGDSDTSGAGDVTMLSGSSLDAGAGTIDIAGANVDARSLSTTNSSAAAIMIDARNGNVITRDAGVNALGDITIHATGSITLEDDGVNTGVGGSVDIEADGDVISTGSGIDTTNNAAAGGNIDITSNSGQVDISNGSLLTGDGGSITVNAVTGFTTLNTSLTATNGSGGGSVEANVSDGTLSITGGEVTVDDAGTILLTAKGTTSDIQLDTSLTSSDGSITLLADNDITLTATTSILSQSSGNITLTADNDGSSAGSITMASGSRVESQGGQIQLSAAGDIALSGITTAGGRVDITSALGEISDNDSTAVNNVTANQLVLNAKLGIGQLIDAIDTAVSFLEADAGTGGLFLDNTGDLTVGGITAQDGLNADQDIVIHNTGTLDLTETVQSATGSITLDTTETLTVDLATTISTLGTGAILLTSSRNIKLNNGSNLKTVNGGITLLANDGGATTGDFVGVEADNASLSTSGTGAISITGFGGSDALTGDHHGVYLHSGTTVSSSASGTDAGTITINGTAGDGIDVNHGVFIDGAATNVTSADGTIDITGSSDAGSGFVLSDQAQIVSNGTGANAADIMINGSTTADQAGVQVTSLVQSIDGAISITGNSTGGGAASLGTLIQSSAGQVLTTNGPITISGISNGDDGIEISSEALVSATDSGTIELLGESTGSGSGVHLDATLKSKTGTITLTAEDDILLGSSALIGSTSGTVTLTADNAAGSNGDPITMTNGALINAGSGEINLTADGDVLLGGLQTTGTVNVTSLSAAISDNGDSDTDIVASTAVLEAVTGIGDGNPLETQIGTLSASVSDVGGLMIDNKLAIELLDVSTFDGAITVNNTATITATSVVSGNASNSDSNDITLTATGTNSDILVTTITASGLADVILTADDGILDTVDGDSHRITADDLNMSSSSASGANEGIDVDTDVNSVTADVNTKSGGIRIDEVDGITLTQLTTLDGPIIVNANGTIEVLAVTSTNNTSSDSANGITLTATGADSDILVTTLTAKNGADITLNADRDVLDSDSTDSELTSGDLLTIVAGRNIGGITNVFTEAGIDPLQTSVLHLNLTSGDQIVIDNTGTTPDLVKLDAGTGTAGTTYVKATDGALNVATTAGISNSQDTISLVSNVSITVPTGLETSNLRLDAPDIIDFNGGAIDVNAVNAILFNSGSEETVNITAQQFDGTAGGTFFTISNDSPALELIDLDSDGLSLTGGTNTDLSLSSVGSITVTNLVQALGSGTLFLETTDTAADLVLNHNLLSDTGAVTISTANDIFFNGTSNLTSTSGAVILTADADNSTVGGITMADGTYLDAGDGTVSLSASDDITLSQVITTNNTSSAIQIDTDASLIDGGDTNGEDLIADEVGAQVTIVATEGAGKASDPNGPLETRVDQINVTNQSSDEIRIIESGDVIVHNLTQNGTGDIEVYAAGDILLNGLIKTLSSHVLLDAQGAIIDQNDGVPGEVNIQASSLEMNAVSGIGTGDTLEMEVDTFSAETTDGDVLLHNTATTGVTATSITTGTGNIEFTQAGNVSLIIQQASTADGSITVSNTGDAQTDTLTLTSVSAGGDAPSIDVSTVNFGNILLGNVAALEGSISVNSAGEINDALDDQASPAVDLNAASGSLTLEAVNGIGNANPVELSAGTLSVNTSTGNNNLQQVSSEQTGPVTVTKLTTGTGSIDYTQTGQESATFEQISTTDSDITLNADGSLLFENPGALLNVVSTDGSGSIQVTATGSDSSITVNDGFGTAGGTIDLSAQHSLNFGSAGDLSSANGKITLLADSAAAGAGGGSITMSDGTVFDSGTGIVDLTAGDAITVGQLMTTTLTRLTSTAGDIVDAGDTGGRDIIADELVLHSATGAGSANALETAVSQLAAHNSTSGSIQIHNNLGGAALTIGTVDGLVGVTNAAGTAGDIFISNASPLTVNAPITNSSGGNIDLESTGPGDLTLNASVRASGGNGNINLEAGNGFLAINDTGSASDHSVAGTGVFSGHGDSGVLLDSSATLNSETGAIAGLPPDLRNLLTPQILPTGLATITGDFGRFTEQNFFITIDWGDGTVETFNFADPGSFVFQHTYTTNPDPQNPAADIPILVTMQGDKQFTFSDGNGSLDFTTQADLLETPGEGLATIAIDTTPQVPHLVFPRQDVILDASSLQQVIFNMRENQLMEAAITEANKNAERLIFLRILAPNGDAIEDVPLDESDLDNLPKLFNTLPDGRYQIYLKEAGEERVRLLMDVDIRNGKASDVTEEQSNPPTNPDQQTPGDNNQNTRRTHEELPTVTLRDLDPLTTVVMTEGGATDLTDRIDLLEQFLINEAAEWQTILPREPQTQDTQETRAFPLPAELEPQLETSEKAWSSAALLSGYFHGRSLFRKPASQLECETAMEKYGNRLLNRRYNLNRRSR